MWQHRRPDESVCAPTGIRLRAEHALVGRRVAVAGRQIVHKNTRAARVPTHAGEQRLARASVLANTARAAIAPKIWQELDLMPPRKRARKTAVASASTVGEASLLDLPTGWEKALSLPSLKQVAARSGLERGWQAIGKEHRAELVAALAQRAAEWRSFVASVLPLEVALQKASLWTLLGVRRSTPPSAPPSTWCRAARACTSVGGSC